MKYKLIAADMDGTLLNDDSVMTERTKSAVKAAVEAGVLFVASSGRPLLALDNINSLFDKDLPFIVFNGASVVMGKSKKILFSYSLQFDYVRQIYNFGLKLNVPVIMWINERLWVSRGCEKVREYQKISGAEINIISDINDFKNDSVSKMLWIDTPDNIRRYQRDMDEHFNGRVNCQPSQPKFLEFVNAEASKGNALCEIGKIYGIDRSEMIAVGDSYNDLSMLEYAGFGIAMQNAPDDIKDVCKYVTLSNNDDGVAAVIDKFILEK